jgi:hypothetical protein
MIFPYYNTEIPVGTQYSWKKFIGGNNTAAPLTGIPTQCLFIKGATATLQVTLQTAAVLTPVDQQVTILDTDWIDKTTYTADTVTDIPTLNGLWVRFKVINSGGSPAPLTVCMEQ